MKKILKFPIKLIGFVIEVALIPVAWVLNKIDELIGMGDD